MNSNPQTEQAYDPSKLLDGLAAHLGLPSDAALANALEVSRPMISKIRHRKIPVSASILIRMHEVSQLDIRQLRMMMGDRRTKHRFGEGQYNGDSRDSSSSAHMAATALPPQTSIS